MQTFYYYYLLIRISYNWHNVHVCYVATIR